MPPTLDARTNTRFSAARNFTPPRDPLVLDLDGDGLELKAVSSKLLFDHDADGVKTGTGWADADDGFLVRDLNGNGVIDSGQELFGEDTVKRNGQRAAHGFDALADLDANGDGNITSIDAAWSQLQVWRDLNQDGISQSNELSRLDALNITRIGVNGSGTGPQAGQTINHNRVALSTTFTKEGADRTVGAIDLESNPFFSNIPAEHVDEIGNPVTLTKTAQALPQMNGSGMVRNLRAAMSLTGAAADELEDAVVAFEAATTRGAQLAQVDVVITEWAQTSSYWSDLETTLGGTVTLTPPEGMSKAEYRNLVAVLEAFNGSRFYGAAGQPMPAGQTANTVNGVTTHTITPPANQSDLLKQAYAALKESVYAAMAVQTRLKPYLDSIELNVSGSGVSFDTTGLHQLLQQRYDESAQHGVEDLIELGRFASASMQAVDFPVTGLLREWSDTWPVDSPLRALLASLDVFTPDATAGFGAGSGRSDFYLGDARNNLFAGEDGDDVLDGGDGDDTLYGGNGNDVMLGGSGNDTLYTATYDKVGNVAAMDVLDGGAGDDTLMGGYGSQTYRFGRGDGQDLIDNAVDGTNPTIDPTVGKQDVLQFKAGISAGDVSLRRSGDDLVAQINGSTDQFMVVRYFENDGVSSQGYALDAIRFEDGTSWGTTQVKAMVVQGTEGNDAITGYATNDVLSGGAGEDALYGKAGDDTLKGEDGNDMLFGGDGSDLLIGGAGNDLLFAAEALGGGHADAVDVLDGGAGDDYLRGASGSQTYVFGRGDGQDTIVNLPSMGSFQHEPTLGKQDVLQFKAGVSASDVSLRRVGDNLVAQINGSADQVTVQSYFAVDGASPQGYALDAIRFEDGTSWDMAHVKAMVLRGTDGNDTLFSDGSKAGEVDALEGGAGNDRLIGDFGSQTYLFGRGDGQDTIANLPPGRRALTDTTVGKQDVLQFKAGIVASDVTLSRQWNDLIVTIKGSTDQVTVLDHFDTEAPGNALDAIRFADSTGWNTEQVHVLVRQGTDGDDPIIGHDTDDTLDGGAGNDQIVGRAGNDVLIGGPGDDTLYGEAGNNLLDGGTGNDVLHGDSADDTLLGGDGDDTLFGNGGNDVLKGGAGNDALFAVEPEDGTSPGAVAVLDGGAGDDYLQGDFGSQTYLFGRGDGQDIVMNLSARPGGQSDPTVGKQDVLQFKAGISARDVSLSREEDHLIVKLNGSSDQITVLNYFTPDSASRPVYALDAIRFDDGTGWDFAQVRSAATATTTDTATTAEKSSTREAIASSQVPLQRGQESLAAERMWQSMSAGQRELNSAGDGGGTSLHHSQAEAAHKMAPMAPQTEAQLINAMADAFMQSMAECAPTSAQTSFVPLQPNLLVPVIAANVF
ncbi:calcium-binding protein [Hydrogenophaga sp.]|uniref:calcium-binding protein n=1 Tax=Hydrogenophaga sp. TaxID=1904254 RepID=UPI00272726F8|nr:calcium-binding protein [Hydrogenophaga sp.]MDO9438628.1 calcium-binding protein [Hydrogenophaga sp.]